MPLIKDNQLVDDHWVPVAADDEIPIDGDIVLSLTRLDEFVASKEGRKGALGVALEPDDAPSVLAALIEHVDLVVLNLPAFTDGRAYSQATYLREHLRFDGEIRVRGEVLVDQLRFMKRCGIDSFEIIDERHLKVWQKQFADLNHAYQRRVQPEGVTGIRAARALKSPHG